VQRSVSFTPVVNSKYADQIRRFEGEKDPPFADAEAKFTGTVFEGLHIPVARRRETHRSRIDPCLNDSIQTGHIAHRGWTKN
jgi:hypothetical protein